MCNPKRLLLFFLALPLSAVAHGQDQVLDYQPQVPIYEAKEGDTPGRCSRKSCLPPPDDKYVDGITLTITSKPFVPKAHKIAECKQVNPCMYDKPGQPGQVYLAPCAKNICSIDGNPGYGANGKTPKQQVASLIFEKNGKKVALDVSSMYNPYVNNSNIKQYLQVLPMPGNSPDNPDSFYQVTGYFSHGDGDDSMYIGLWTVWQDGSFRNYLGDFGSLLDLTERVVWDFNYKSLETIMRENQRE